MNLSFVIRSKNESRWIGHSIQSIVDIYDNPQIVVIDNESDDDSLDVVKLFMKDRNNLDLRILDISRRDYTPGRSINLAMSNLKNMSNNSVVCILSAHCQIKTIDFNQLESMFKEKNCCAVMGKQVPIYRGKKILNRYVWQNFSYEKVTKNPMEQIPDSRPFFHNAFSFIKYSHWKQNKFDESCTTKEDRHWIKEQIDNGKHCYFTPDSVCHHYWTPNGATWKGQG